eukprot:gb/GEZN01005468.1/.p1 GENE.gb/GEZN01005468.1/~~gb/GEZN01005468.1/.p1  ORF type:complete len:307 (-),score=30.30 gb/GEZN01005468.1/:370-1290(-)
MWIVKPSSSSCGRAIRIYQPLAQEGPVSPLEHLANYLNTNYIKEDSVVVQKYIHNPVLYRQRKFDIRCYVLIFPHALRSEKPNVPHSNPLLAWYYDGYIRICGKQYPGAPISDKMAHVTNFHVQRGAAGFDKKEDTIDGVPVRTSFDDFIEYISADSSESSQKLRRSLRVSEDLIGTQEAKRILGHRIREAMKKTLAKSIAAIAEKFRQEDAQIDQFALLGADILLDEDGDAWLLEYTKGPAFRRHPEYMDQLHSGLVRETVEMVLEIHKCRKYKRPWWVEDKVRLQSLRNYEQIWPEQNTNKTKK